MSVQTRNLGHVTLGQAAARWWQAGGRLVAGRQAVLGVHALDVVGRQCSCAELASGDSLHVVQLGTLVRHCAADPLNSQEREEGWVSEILQQEACAAHPWEPQRLKHARQAARMRHSRQRVLRWGRWRRPRRRRRRAAERRGRLGSPSSRRRRPTRRCSKKGRVRAASRAAFHLNPNITQRRCTATSGAADASLQCCYPSCSKPIQ